jgi:predicted O-methyltransferase YrrM
MLSPLCDARAEGVLERLHALGDRQFKTLVRHYLLNVVPRRWFGRKYTYPDRKFMLDKLVPLDRDKCCLCYLLCRAVNAKRVVEFATSFGVSTIYLAAAVRDNARADGSNGLVIGTEIEPNKAAAARANFAEAGLSEFIDLREGDARETLKDTGGPVDLLLLDSWIPLAKPILELVAPRLRPGAVVLCDNTAQFRREYQEFLDYIRNPDNGFRSMVLPHAGGFEFSVRLPRSSVVETP